MLGLLSWNHAEKTLGLDDTICARRETTPICVEKKNVHTDRGKDKTGNHLVVKHQCLRDKIRFVSISSLTRYPELFSLFDPFFI